MLDKQKKFKSLGHKGADIVRIWDQSVIFSVNVLFNSCKKRLFLLLGQICNDQNGFSCLRTAFYQSFYHSLPQKRHRLMSVPALKDQGLQRLQGSYPWLIRSSLFPEYVILFFSLMSLTLGHVGRWNLPVFVLTM